MQFEYYIFIKAGIMVNNYPLNRDSLHLHPLLLLALPPQALLPRGWMDWQTDLESLGPASMPETHTERHIRKMWNKGNGKQPFNIICCKL